jgi:hypothetical protein
LALFLKAIEVPYIKLGIKDNNDKIGIECGAKEID